MGTTYSAVNPDRPGSHIHLEKRAENFNVDRERLRKKGEDQARLKENWEGIDWGKKGDR